MNVVMLTTTGRDSQFKNDRVFHAFPNVEFVKGWTLHEKVEKISVSVSNAFVEPYTVTGDGKDAFRGAGIVRVYVACVISRMERRKTWTPSRSRLYKRHRRTLIPFTIIVVHHFLTLFQLVLLRRCDGFILTLGRLGLVHALLLILYKYLVHPTLFHLDDKSAIYPVALVVLGTVHRVGAKGLLLGV